MQTVELLEQRYRTGVLSAEPNQKFEELRKRYLENPENFSKVAAEGLDKTYWTTEKILESDLEGSNLEFHPNMPVTVMAIPEKMAPRLMKKLGFEGFTGLAFTKHHFKKSSPFHGTYVILLTDDENFETCKKHEESHVLYRDFSRPRNDAYSVSCETEGKKHCEAQSLMAEMDMLKELLAYSITEWDKNDGYRKKRFSRSPFHPDLKWCQIQPDFENTTRALLKQLYVPRSAEYVADVFDDSGVLPDCGIVSRSAAKTVVKDAATGYFEDVVDSGVDAFKILNGDMPEEKVEMIFIACGPSKEEVLSGNGYLRPSKELELWSKHYREILANV